MHDRADQTAGVADLCGQPNEVTSGWVSPRVYIRRKGLLTKFKAPAVPKSAFDMAWKP